MYILINKAKKIPICHNKVSQDLVIMSEIVRCNWMLQFLHVLKIRKKMSFLFKNFKISNKKIYIQKFHWIVDATLETVIHSYSSLVMVICMWWFSISCIIMQSASAEISIGFVCMKNKGAIKSNSLILHPWDCLARWRGHNNVPNTQTPDDNRTNTIGV